MTKLHELGFELLLHPPYNPDLAPSDFFLFSDLKRRLAGQKFCADEESNFRSLLPAKEYDNNKNLSKADLNFTLKNSAAKFVRNGLLVALRSNKGTAEDEPRNSEPWSRDDEDT
ncbi:hypothetical protein TNCV_2109231 [Trichonephila clavipes]|nr:hypothetical protein TNCV_2109231 [Trichonephila clavipes]